MSLGESDCLINDAAKLVVKVIERVGSRLVDAVDHVEQGGLNFLDLGLGQEPAGLDLFEVVRKVIDPQFFLLQRDGHIQVGGDLKLRTTYSRPS